MIKMTSMMMPQPHPVQLHPRPKPNRLSAQLKSESNRNSSSRPCRQPWRLCIRTSRRDVARNVSHALWANVSTSYFPASPNIAIDMRVMSKMGCVKKKIANTATAITANVPTTTGGTRIGVASVGSVKNAARMTPK